MQYFLLFFFVILHKLQVPDGLRGRFWGRKGVILQGFGEGEGAYC